ncbi:MAG: MATE family efflux transporter [Streptobacillus sp.]
MVKNKNILIYKSIFSIGIPVLLENLVYNLINFLDNFMVGRENPALGLGVNAVSGLGIINQIYFVFIVASFGLYSGASVLSSQYYGKKDYKHLSNILSFLIIASLLISFPFLLIALFIPEKLVSFYTNDALVIKLAVEYFRIAVLTFPLSGLSFAFSMQLRVINKAKYAFYSSLIGLLVNAVGNILLIPIFGISGAAFATVVARFLALVYMIYIVYSLKLPIIDKLKNMINIETSLVKSILWISLPTFLHEIFWVVGTNFKTRFYSKIGVVEFAAIVTTTTISSIVFSVFSGISNASAVIIGNELGKGDLKKAELVSKVCIKLMFLLSIILGLVLILTTPLILRIMGINTELNKLTNSIMYMEAISLVYKAISLLFVVGILRAGGDIYFGMIVDMVGVWFISLPLIYLGLNIFNLDIKYVYLLGGISDLFSSIICYFRYKKKKWLKRILE